MCSICSFFRKPRLALAWTAEFDSEWTHHINARTYGFQRIRSFFCGRQRTTELLPLMGRWWAEFICLWSWGLFLPIEAHIVLCIKGLSTMQVRSCKSDSSTRCRSVLLTPEVHPAQYWLSPSAYTVILASSAWITAQWGWPLLALIMGCMCFIFCRGSTELHRAALPVCRNTFFSS